MNWSALGAIAELLGAAGVIASLLYLATQMRQSLSLARVEAQKRCIASMREVPSVPTLVRHFRVLNLR